MTIYKVTTTLKSAERYVAKYLANNNDVTIKQISGLYYISTGKSGYSY